MSARVLRIERPYELPEGVLSVNVYMNGHGPAAPDKQTFNLNEYGMGPCGVPECVRCIREYRRDLNFPRRSAEAEIFV